MKPKKCLDKTTIRRVGICGLHCLPCHLVPEIDCPHSDKYVNKFENAVKKIMEAENDQS